MNETSGTPRRSVVEELRSWSAARWREYGTVSALLALAACAESAPLGPVREAEPQAVIDSVIVGYQQVVGWPVVSADLRLGEVAGVDVDGHGHVFAFQRAERGWDTETVAPIDAPTVLQLESATGRVLSSWGSARFRLPHGLTVDLSDNIWLTDAALHQVFEFSHDGKPLRTLGEAGIGKWDQAHFNRPTDVTVRADGGFYVSDGYDNQRVVELDAAGGYLHEWGKQGSAQGEFALPHGITSAGGLLYVADRENDRVVVLDSTGAFRRAWSPVPGGHVYAVALDGAGNIFVAVRNDGLGIGGVVQLDGNGQVMFGIGAVPRGNSNYLPVHDLAVAADGAIYVAETRARGLRKYVPVYDRITRR